MPSYWTLLALVLPVFAVIAAGAGARSIGWLKPEADESLLKLVVNLLYPCLIFDNVLGNAALRAPGNLLLGPLLGFLTMAGGILFAYFVAKRAGFAVGAGLRTFAFSVGIFNYGYMAIPLVERLFGRETLGVLFVFNVGCEAAIWTVGILILAGVSVREGWRRVMNPPVYALVLAVVLNLSGGAEWLPEVLRRSIHMVGACAVPLGLLVIGATLVEYLAALRLLVDRKVTPVACALRLGVIPLAMLAVAALAPLPTELRSVLVVQAAMPAGILPIVIAKHHGGRPLTAVQVVFGTTAVGLFIVPLWLKLGLRWIG
ncbi:MAG: AEC family transporter [Verrucomicrobia bacterium]|nr:MAG: AEC family transporter [Verrucomicrobiota bacterium]